MRRSASQGSLGGCAWSLAEGVLTIAPGARSNELPACWTVQEDDDWTECWLWCELLGERVHEVEAVVLAPGVCAGKSLSHLLGYSGYGEGKEPHAFDRVRTVDLSGLDCGLATEMEGMFFDCAELRHVVPPTCARRPRPTTTAHMFAGCSALEEIDLVWLDLSAAGDLTCMFADCAALGALDLTGQAFAEDASFDELFAGCDLGYRVYARDGLDSRVAEQMVFALRGSTCALQLEADMRIAEQKLEEFARCRPYTLLQASAYTNAAHELLVEHWALGPRPNPSQLGRLWGYRRRLEELLATFGAEPTEREVREDEWLLGELMRFVQQEPQARKGVGQGLSAATLDYLCEASSMQWAFTIWSKVKDARQGYYSSRAWHL